MESEIHLHSDLLDRELTKAVKIAYNNRDLKTLGNFIEIGFDMEQVLMQ